MTSSKEPSIISFPKKKSREKLSSPESKPKKTLQGNAKELPPDPFLNGSVDLKKNSESTKKNSLKNSGNKMPVPRFRQSRNRVLEALKRLGVKPEEVDVAPQVTVLLKCAEGGLKAVLQAMRSSARNETIRTFLQKFDSIPSGDRDKLPWEAIVISAELDFDTFLGAASFSIANFASNKSKIIMSSSHPKVTEARVKYALMAGGEKDRFAIDTMVGAMPSAKGPTFIGNAVFNGPSQHGNPVKELEAESAAAIFVDDGNLGNLFPSSSETQNELIEIRKKLLE